MRYVIIVACPKSGTQYISQLLTRLGLDFGHEAACGWAKGKDGKASWLLGAGYKAIPFDGQPPLDEFENPIILHQVRHPVGCISSSQKIAIYAWEYIAKFIPLKRLNKENLIENCMRLWYYWNIRCEKLAEWTYRIENLEEIWEEFCQKINHPELIEKKDMIKDIPKNVGSSKPYTPITIDKMIEVNKRLARKIVKLARIYGYKI